jgi:enoyl-CoA hydratase/carnithine racemase
MSVIVQDRGAVRRLVLDRPAARNALDPDTLEALDAALSDADRPGVRVLELGASGERAWCSGADLSAMLRDPAGRERAGRAYAALVLHVLRFPKPTVAVCDAPVLAGGVGLFAACDLAVVSPRFTLSLPEAERGLWPMMVGAVLGPLLPPRVMVELAMTGRKLTAAEALALGLVNAVADDVEAAAAELSGRIARMSPNALRQGKRAWQAARGRPAEEAIPALQGELAGLLEHPDAAEGILAFLQKRGPAFEG